MQKPMADAPSSAASAAFAAAAGSSPFAPLPAIFSATLAARALFFSPATAAEEGSRDHYALSTEEKLAIVVKDSPALLGILEELKAKAAELERQVQPVLATVRPPPPAAGGGGGDDDEGAVPLLPRDALAKLLPPPSALQTDADDPDLDAGVGDLVALAADAAAMIEAVGALEADEWRNSMLWDAARTAVQEKCVAELARRARVVPGPRFQGRLAASPKLAGN